jgi:hypothetical protein
VTVSKYVPAGRFGAAVVIVVLFELTTDKLAGPSLTVAPVPKSWPKTTRWLCRLSTVTCVITEFVVARAAAGETRPAMAANNRLNEKRLSKGTCMRSIS